VRAYISSFAQRHKGNDVQKFSKVSPLPISLYTTSIDLTFWEFLHVYKFFARRHKARPCSRFQSGSICIYIYIYIYMSSCEGYIHVQILKSQLYSEPVPLPYCIQSLQNWLLRISIYVRPSREDMEVAAAMDDEGVVGVTYIQQKYLYIHGYMYMDIHIAILGGLRHYRQQRATSSDYRTRKRISLYTYIMYIYKYKVLCGLHTG